MALIFDMDKAADVDALQELTGGYGYQGVKQREKLYGDIPGVGTLEDALDELISQADWEERLRLAHEQQATPIFAMRRWSPIGYRWNQDGISYCWTWSGTAGVLTREASENKPFKPLAPVSMGYLVGWYDRGNYLEDFVRGAQEDGIAEAPDGDMNSLNRSSSYWAGQSGTRKLHRLGRALDTDPRRMDQFCVTGLVAGMPGYAAWNRLSHAMLIVDIQILPNGRLRYIIRNSHNGPDVIYMDGGTPDECIFFAGTK